MFYCSTDKLVILSDCVHLSLRSDWSRVNKTSATERWQFLTLCCFFPSYLFCWEIGTAVKRQNWTVSVRVWKNARIHAKVSPSYLFDFCLEPFALLSVKFFRQVPSSVFIQGGEKNRVTIGSFSRPFRFILLFTALLFFHCSPFSSFFHQSIARNSIHWKPKS